MFCKNCGSEITKGMKFCKDCGSPVEWKEEEAQMSSQGNNSGKSGASQITLLVVAVLGILQLIFWFCKYESWEAGIFGSQAASMHELANGFVNGLTITLIVLSIAAAGFVAWKNASSMKNFLVLPLVTSAWILVVLIFQRIRDAVDLKDMGMGDYLNIDITFVGWLYIIVNVVVILLSVATMKKMKKA